jgi:glycogen operon protein
VRDIGWFKADGDEMSEQDWNVGFAKSLGMYLNGANFHIESTLGRPDC